MSNGISDMPKPDGMTDDELMDALSGLYAYDTGSIDSGIKDERLRARVIAEIRAMPMGEYQRFPGRLSRLAREMFLSDARIEQGHGLEDVQSFTTWLEEQLDE